MKQENFKDSQGFLLFCAALGTLNLWKLWRPLEYFGFSVLLQTEPEIFQAGHPLKITPQVLLFTLFLKGLNEISN